MVTFKDKYSHNIILLKSFEFAKKIVLFTQLIQNNRHFVIANQLLKSGTSIGANIKESQNAESKKDFIHKMKIALKEADETEYWLFLCNEVEDYPDTDCFLEDVFEIQKILNKIITTAKSDSK